MVMREILDYIFSGQVCWDPEEGGLSRPSGSGWGSPPSTLWPSSPVPSIFTADLTCVSCCTWHLSAFFRGLPLKEKQAGLPRSQAVSPILSATVQSEPCARGIPAHCHLLVSKPSCPGPTLSGNSVCLHGTDPGTSVGGGDYSLQVKTSRLRWWAPALSSRCLGPVPPHSFLLTPLYSLYPYISGDFTKPKEGSGQWLGILPFSFPSADRPPPGTPLFMWLKGAHEDSAIWVWIRGVLMHLMPGSWSAFSLCSSEGRVSCSLSFLLLSLLLTFLLWSLCLLHKYSECSACFSLNVRSVQNHTRWLSSSLKLSISFHDVTTFSFL